MNSDSDLQAQREQFVQKIQSIDDELLRRRNERIQNVRNHISQNLSVEEQEELWKQRIPGEPSDISQEEFEQWLQPSTASADVKQSSQRKPISLSELWGVDEESNIEQK